MPPMTEEEEAMLSRLEPFLLSIKDIYEGEEGKKNCPFELYRSRIINKDQLVKIIVKEIKLYLNLSEITLSWGEQKWRTCT